MTQERPKTIEHLEMEFFKARGAAVIKDNVPVWATHWMLGICNRAEMTELENLIKKEIPTASDSFVKVFAYPLELNKVINNLIRDYRFVPYPGYSSFNSRAEYLFSFQFKDAADD